MEYMDKPGGRDIGGGHWILFEYEIECDGECRFTKHAVDPSPGKWMHHIIISPDEDRAPDQRPIGLYDNHRSPAGLWCGGHVGFGNVPGASERALHELASLDPLTVTPSLLCSCGEHGFITNGLWVPC